MDTADASPDADPYERVLEALHEHGNVRRALRETGLSNGNFYRRLASDEAYSERYTRAKLVGMVALADESLDIGEEEPAMVETQFGQRIDPGWVALQKLRIDQRKWLLSKLVPKQYGDRVTLAGDADNPLAIDVVDARAALLRGLAPKPAGDGAPGEGGEPHE